MLKTQLENKAIIIDDMHPAEGIHPNEYYNKVLANRLATKGDTIKATYDTTDGERTDTIVCS